MDGYTGDELEVVAPLENWKPKVLLAGAVLGAVVGTVAAYLVVNNAERAGPPKVSASQGVKLGVLVFGLLRSVASLLQDE